MNRLRNCRCYLIGAMDKIPGGGVIWRRRIQEDLRHFGIHWLDTTNKPCKMGVEDEASRELRHAKKEQGDWQWVANQMCPIRRVDLRMVDLYKYLTYVNERTSIKHERRCPVFNIKGTQISRHPGTSESAATFDEGRHFNFDHQGFYKDELGFPWPENLMR